MLRDDEIANSSKVITEGESPALICLLDNPVNPLLPYIMKEFPNGRKFEKKQFF